MITGPTTEDLAALGQPSEELIGALAAVIVGTGHHAFDAAHAHLNAMTGDDCVRAHNLLVDVDEMLRERWTESGAPNGHLLRSNN